MSYWIYIEHYRRPGEEARPKVKVRIRYDTPMDAEDAAQAMRKRLLAEGQSVVTHVVNENGEPVDFRGNRL